MTSQTSSGLVAVSKSPLIHLFYDVTPALPISPSKPVLVLSHSLSAATWLWDSLVPALADKYTIIRYDIRFHGRSPLIDTPGFNYEEGHTIADLASDVVKLLDHLGVRQAHAFIGLSIGGGIAVALAGAHVERFRHFIVVGTRAHATAEDEKIWEERIAFAKTEGIPALAGQSVERWFGPAWREENAALVADIARRVGEQSLEGYVANVQALRRLDLWPYADAVGRRGDGGMVFFVAGEEDAATVIEETRGLAARAGSEVVVVEGAGHITHVQQPERFLEVVRGRLEG
ncbi:Alpha/Beta hydrolase protein [Plectosphaerella plurivora]|uniref:Alpha/Beta hydrolase protein n=1 Tax=Plectosphaerella plurivora TaxID=936078 RepID=A0A9P8V4B5_9PEZI|nr:Alpha/Beta hydrolase protein [Plectosphaerella plurivora]